jgi:hypothetical protein
MTRTMGPTGTALRRDIIDCSGDVGAVSSPTKVTSSQSVAGTTCLNFPPALGPRPLRVYPSPRIR